MSGDMLAPELAQSSFYLVLVVTVGGGLIEAGLRPLDVALGVEVQFVYTYYVITYFIYISYMHILYISNTSYSIYIFVQISITLN